MEHQEIIELYELYKVQIKHNENGNWDYDLSHLMIEFDINDLQTFKSSETIKSELCTVKQLQDVFDRRGWELKNATKGLDYGGLLMVEHHQSIHDTGNLVPSGILISKAGYWWYGLDEVGFIVLSREFLNWCYEYNLKTKMMKDEPIKSQTWNRGYAFLIPFDLLPFLIKKFKENLK